MFFDDMMFSIVPGFIGIIFIIIFGLIIYSVISSVKQGIKNNNSPLLTVPAEVVSKRIHVQGDHSRTTYYVTFEVQSGDRMELIVDGSEYGMLVERDLGLLSFQGTRYISFERQK
ncbi:DUF2500 domain-containing protein [Solibacillus silvestris]|uniref:DUF2500 domain-containing protein n=1 Tax=Solibacillus silvestris TaxID=76853 RepID=UPI003F80CB02